jgi:hypothetical protein
MKSKSQLDRTTDRTYIPNYKKYKSFVETVTPYNKILIFEKYSYVCQKCFFIFDTDHQIYSVHLSNLFLIS